MRQGPSFKSFLVYDYWYSFAFVKIAIVNGPNLNLTGKREPGIYGDQRFDALMADLSMEFQGLEFIYFQSNVEGEMINFLHALDEQADVLGILLNAGGYTHTSVALGDAVAAISKRVIEVHMSNIFAREDYRHVSFIGRHCEGCIAGFGMGSYLLGVRQLLGQL